MDAAVDEAEAILRALLARDVAFRCILLGEGRRSDELADLVRPRRLLRLSRSVGSQELLSRLA